MKTHVIQLDSFDDFISIQDKLSWSKAPRILIVWPDHGRIKLVDMDIHLLLRKAEYLGSQIAFVFDDAELLKSCNHFGVPVFSSIPEAQRRPWRRPKRMRRLFIQNLERKPLVFIDELKAKSGSTDRITNRWTRLVFFFLGLTAVLAIVGLFIPSAKVYIKPKPELFVVTINARSNPSISDVNLAGAIPAEVVTKTFDMFIEGQSSGTIRIPSKNASGKVEFKNLTDQQITIPSGVIVRTVNEPVIRFSTVNEITLDPGVDSIKTAEVTSIIGGVVGNVPSGSIQAIEGDIGGNVMVFNSEPIFGGVETKTYAPSESDYEKAKLELIDKINEKAYQEFSKLSSNSFFLPIQTLQLIEIENENHFPEVGEPGDQFKLELKAKFSIWKIDKEDIHQIAKNAISATIKKDFKIVDGEVLTNIIENPHFDDTGSLRWKFESSQEIVPAIDDYQVFQLISGKDIDQAINSLTTNYQLQSSPIIEVSPSFWRRLPYLPFRNQLLIEG